jgi:Fe-S cluster assembly scaffold protein SufB
MNISKNWFYKLSDFESNDLSIENDLIVSIFDDLNNNINIEIWENSRVEFYSVLEDRNDFKITFIQNKKNSNLKVNYLLLSKDDTNLKAKIYSELSADFTKVDVKIVSIVWTNWFIDLDWIIKINEWIKKVDANLVEDNLFLGNSWKVKWIPTLLVRSDDVKASHSCKMEKISDDKLFYLRSRWIDKEYALSIMIEAKIKSLFLCISMLDNNFYENLINSIVDKIKITY